MKQQARASLDAYYRDGERWAGERLALLRSSRRIARIAAGAAIAVAVLEAGALLSLLPIDAVEPYAVMVGGQTGRVQALASSDTVSATPDGAVIQSMIARYVAARESFDVDEVQRDYRRVALWSALDARVQYIAAMRNGSPASPLLRYPRDTIVETRITSVSPLDPRSALVRFETRRRDADGRAYPGEAWMATLRYRLSATPLSVADRFDDPLGFEVIDYRRTVDPLAPTVPPITPRLVVPDSTPAVAPRAVVPRPSVRSYPAPASTPSTPRATRQRQVPQRTTPSGIELTL